jgi:hypothetical protein
MIVSMTVMFVAEEGQASRSAQKHRENNKEKKNLQNSQA